MLRIPLNIKIDKKNLSEYCNNDMCSSEHTCIHAIMVLRDILRVVIVKQSNARNKKVAWRPPCNFANGYKNKMYFVSMQVEPGRRKKGEDSFMVQRIKNKRARLLKNTVFVSFLTLSSFLLYGACNRIMFAKELMEFKKP